MKILNTEQLREADRITIERQGITSWQLMERATTQLFLWIEKHLPEAQSFCIMAGVGNNGGDGLALARMLLQSGKQVSVTTSRQQIGDVLRNQANYTGRDKTISILDGLLDKLDASKLGNSITYGYIMPTNDEPVAGAGIAQALLTSRALNKTVFGLSTETARHAQEHAVNEKIARSDKTMQRKSTESQQTPRTAPTP